MKKYSVLILLVIFPFKAFAAWDGTVSGKINVIHVTGAENYGFRVSIAGKTTLCGTKADGSNTESWAYLNKSDSNYLTYVSVLLAAKMAASSVTLYMNKASNEYCRIGYITIQ